MKISNWYKQSFDGLINTPTPNKLKYEAQFAAEIEKIYERHAYTLIMMAKGNFIIQPTRLYL
jgi:hypothetical protein